MQAQTSNYQTVQATTSEFWIPREALGVLDAKLLDMLYLIGQTKKTRLRKFRELVRVLKVVVPIGKEEVKHIGFCCDSTGALGLLITCMPSVKAQTPLPSVREEIPMPPDDDPYPSRGADNS